MCEFCESKKEINILSYDNYDSMRISFGQYQGVNVIANAYLHGNMLTLGGSGSYRSESDCYYDAEGLDIDNTNSINSKQSYIQIKYCPFCGKKIISNVYEKQKAYDDIKKLNEKLYKLKLDLKYEKMFISFEWKCKQKSTEKIETLLQKRIEFCKSNGWKLDEDEYIENIKYNYIEYKNNLTIDKIKDIYDNFSCDIIYGNIDDRFKYPNDKLPDKFDLNTNIKLYWFLSPKYYSSQYILTESMYKKMVELGYINSDDNEKYKRMKDSQIELKNEIIEIENKIKDIKTYIDLLKD